MEQQSNSLTDVISQIDVLIPSLTALFIAGWGRSLRALYTNQN